MLSFFRSSEFSDWSLTAIESSGNSATWKLHRIIVMPKSSVLSKLNSEYCQVYSLDTVGKILEWCYSGELDVNCMNCIKFYYEALLLGFDELTREIKHFIQGLNEMQENMLVLNRIFNCLIDQFVELQMLDSFTIEICRSFYPKETERQRFNRLYQYLVNRIDPLVLNSWASNYSLPVVDSTSNYSLDEPTLRPEQLEALMDSKPPLPSKSPIRKDYLLYEKIEAVAKAEPPLLVPASSAKSSGSFKIHWKRLVNRRFY